MINRWVVAVISIVLSLGLLWMGRELRKVVDRTSSFKTFLPSNMPDKYVFPIDAVMANLEIQGRKVKGQLPPVSEDGKRTLVLMNKISPEWQKGLEQALEAQAPDTLKDIKIFRLESYIWSVGGQALNVESVLVQLQNKLGETTKFNAMVDSQTGKIIQTWNQPVIDPLNPRDNPGVKIDPRYYQD